MFTQRISMDCSKEQYEKYLKEELLKIGYKEDICKHLSNKFIYNNFMGEVGVIGMGSFTSLMGYDRTYLGSFNAPLFLALAAMTDNPGCGYGEIITNNIKYEPWVSPGHFNNLYWRKASVGEIMKEYGKIESKQTQSISTTPTYKELFEALKETQNLLIEVTKNPTMDRILKNEKLLNSR